MGNFIEVYKCECGYYIPKWKGGGGMLPISPAFSWYDCCPKCGRNQDKIKLVTGRWKYKRIVSGWFWPFRCVTYEKDYFIESGINE